MSAVDSCSWWTSTKRRVGGRKHSAKRGNRVTAAMFFFSYIISERNSFCCDRVSFNCACFQQRGQRRRALNRLTHVKHGSFHRFLHFDQPMCQMRENVSFRSLSAVFHSLHSVTVVSPCRVAVRLGTAR